MGGKMMQDPRPINTNIKTKLINPEINTPKLTVAAPAF